jgi:tRNA(Ile)-lysidine synthase TilS/MesJ
VSLPDKASAALLRLLADHADLSPDACTLVGVSGGRDSVALLDFLVKAGWRHLVVVHLNHGLRGQRVWARRRLCAAGWHNAMALRCVVQRTDMAGDRQAG